MARRKQDDIAEPIQESLRSNAMPPMEEFVRRFAGILSDDAAVPVGVNVMPMAEQAEEEPNDQS